MPATHTARRYLHFGVITLTISGAAAVYLNFEGVKCLTILARSSETVNSQQELQQTSANCFIVTNSYVYSLFGVVAGGILLGLWAHKRRASRDLG
jgi:hypothetical protein